MLRMLFNEPRRKDQGELMKANESIRSYIQLINDIPEKERNQQERRYMIWSGSFIRSLDELEQSQYAAERYGERVVSAYLDEMSEEELDDYHRHLYFYKNAIIRLFAILDKLGQFMNERFRLKTEEIKARFSYFTVLRNMHTNRLYVELEEQLYQLKEQFNDPVERLRSERNLEIHTINADLLDDLLKAAEAKKGTEQRIHTENIQEHLHDLMSGCEMTYHATRMIFTYISKMAVSSSRYPHDLS
ncbi:Cthe_2314 family HEPN domain-containing protein [Paenibacillus sp. UNC451MF]|uniref:Cthe_2314 family HEPN domain-containing protein n=1 Tax=Paenibacillus sp. UNC451MF TaxID=1449063 RepID=UPI00048BF988|nr:Cthe_2314 family HEPN domain-containing protein [Paenibacillus sp. UNC451MF]